MNDRVPDPVGAIAAASHLDGAALSAVWSIPFAGLLLSIALLPLVRAAFLGASFRQGRRILGARAAHTLHHRIRREHDDSRGSAHAAARLYPLHPPAVRAVRRRRRHPCQRQPRRHTGDQHGDPRLRHAVSEPPRHDRRLHGADPPPDPRQSAPRSTRRMSSSSSSSSSAISAARSRRSATRRCFSAFSRASISCGLCSAMLAPMLFIGGILLALFYVIDRRAWSRETAEIKGKSRIARRLRIEGAHNVLYLVAVAGAVLASGIWNRDATIPIGLGIELPRQRTDSRCHSDRGELALMEDHQAVDQGGERVHLGCRCRRWRYCSPPSSSP